MQATVGATMSDVRILEETDRTTGRDALRKNIQAAAALAGGSSSSLDEEEEDDDDDAGGSGGGSKRPCLDSGQ